MRNVVLLIVALVLWAPARAQSAWKKENYETVTGANFRSFAGFKKPIDTRYIDYGLLNACLYYLVNEQRKAAKLPVVPHHRALETAAFFHSKKMGESGFFDHTNPKDATRRLPDFRAKLAGITNPSIAECIHMQWLEPHSTYLSLGEEFVKAWMESPPHHDIMMSKESKAFGAGVFYKTGAHGGLYGTLVFQWFNEVVIDKKVVVDILPY